MFCFVISTTDTALGTNRHFIYAYTNLRGTGNYGVPLADILEHSMEVRVLSVQGIGS